MTTPRRALSFLLVSLAIGGTFACRGRDDRFPHAPVILVTIDTLRADRLPAYGYRTGATPAIDRLVADGLRFESAWAQAPLTLPSHASLMTGSYPYVNGVRSNVGYLLDATKHPTMASLFKAGGYRTGAAVSAYVLRAETGIAAGFDRFDDSFEVGESDLLSSLERPGDEALAALLPMLRETSERPFFLWLHLFEPHAPYAPPEPFRSRFADPYDGEIAAADAIVGRLLAALDERKLYDGTLIVVAADHGEGLGDHGEPQHGVLLYRETTQVPLIVKLPQQRRAGERIARAVGLVDIFPTVLSAVGIEPPASDGLSLLAAPAAPDRRLYSETMYPRLHLGWSELRSLSDSRFRFIDGPDPELYDLAADPHERDNARERERRAFTERRAALAEMPLALAAAAPVSPEEARKLAALGYLAGAAAEPTGPRLDPKQEIHLLADQQRAFALEESGDLAGAAARYRELLEANPAATDLRLRFAGLLRRLGRPTEAREQYLETARRVPSETRMVAVEVAKIDFELGRLDEAAGNARLAAEVAPDDAHTILAAIAVERGQWGEAEREARAALGDAARPRLPALVYLSRSLVEQGRLVEALALLEPAAARLSRGEAKPVATFDAAFGDVLARSGRNEEAEAAFRREIGRFPHTSEAYVRLAILLASERRFAEIRPTLDAMVAASPTPKSLLLAARAMEDLGNLPDAREYRERARVLAARAPGS